MATEAVSLLDRLRRPEYTGENRCIPCTVANLAIASVLAAGVAAALVLAIEGDPWLAVVGAVAVLGPAVAAIYLRGYLVPYTPQLTKRYLPDRVLARFDHHDASLATDPETGVDVERVLLSADVLRERPDGDLEVDPDVETEWFDEMAAVEADTGRETLAALLGVDGDDLTFEEHGEAFVAADGGVRVGRWESRAAFRADVAAARILGDHVDGWETATAPERSRLLSGLRLFIDECPDCGGPVRFGQEVVESCCRSVDVVAVTCEDCGVRLFEMETPDAVA